MVTIPAETIRISADTGAPPGHARRQPAHDSCRDARGVRRARHARSGPRNAVVGDRAFAAAGLRAARRRCRGFSGRQHVRRLPGIVPGDARRADARMSCSASRLASRNAACATCWRATDCSGTSSPSRPPTMRHRSRIPAWCSRRCKRLVSRRAIPSWSATRSTISQWRAPPEPPRSACYHPGAALGQAGAFALLEEFAALEPALDKLWTL
jgi:hypothetical protein